MRIDTSVTITPVTKDSASAKDAPATQRTPSRSDVVQLSSAGTAVTEARPTDVSARLSRIKSMIASGTYPIDLDKLAARIAEEDLR